MELLIYVGKVSLYWVLFFICYRLLLRHHTFFIWNRLYLIVALMISFALPFVIYPASAPPITGFYEATAQSLTISVESPRESTTFTVENLLWFMYFAGVLFMTYKFLTHTRQLIGFLREGELIELDDCKVVLIDSNEIGSFSFLKWIVVNRSDYENHFDAILRHEMVHTKQWHTADILLLEILKIVFWFNPVLLLYKQSMQEIHEFLADSHAPNRDNYARFLVAYALNAPIASLTNHFFKPSQIKSRIQMIYKNRSSKWMLGSYIVAACMIGSVALFVAGCEQKGGTELDTVSERLSAEKMPVTKEHVPTERKVFTVVEEQPMFPGGTKAMYEFLGDNVKYPEPAINAGIEGRVFLSFVVSETGEIGDILVLKGLGYGCDAEAIRVLKAFPKWDPGKQDGKAVNVRYNLPINFQIDENEPGARKKTSLKINTNGENPLFVVDGKITESTPASEIAPETIESVSVYKDKQAIDKYGEKGKNGVVVIKTKQK